MNLDITTMVNCFELGIHYLPVTIIVAVFPALIGMTLGLIFTILYIYKVPFFGNFFQIVVFLMSGVPIVVLLIIVNLIYLVKFNDIMAALHINMTIREFPDFWIGIFVLAVDCTNHMSQTIKGAFQSVDRSQYDAGYSVGLSRTGTLIHVVIPQVIPVAIPGLLNDFVSEFKMTSLVMCVGIMDMFSGAMLACSINYRYLECYIVVSLMYWALVALMEAVFRRVEDKLARYRGAVS